MIAHSLFDCKFDIFLKLFFILPLSEELMQVQTNEVAGTS